MERISTKTLREMKEEHPNLLVINVLEEQQHREMHLPGSICIPGDDVDFVQRVRDELDGEHDIPVVVYCTDESCPKSEFAAERLESAGFEKVFDFEGGVKAWKNNSLPMEGTKVNGAERQTQEETSSKTDQEQSEAKEEQQSSQDENAEAKEDSDTEKEDSDTESDDDANEEGSDETSSGEEQKDESKAQESEAQSKEKESESESEQDKSGSGFEREAEAVWEGMLKDGSGQMTLGSAPGVEMPFTFEKRFGDEEGANPEELLGAALAGCFSMALANEIGGSGYTVDRISTSAKVHVARGDDGFSIETIDLDTTASVGNMEEDALKELVTTVKESCPVARALGGVEIKVHATLANGS